ncbi:MAG: HemK/PrmC family methyltransferase [Sphingobacteriaceae bacterium]|nr:HemK/PrmC family methyltransferase [Sphingobacteriaceae bacterium]
MDQPVRTYQQVKKQAFDHVLAQLYEAGELRAMWGSWLEHHTGHTVSQWARLQYEPFPSEYLADLRRVVAELQTGKPLQYVLNEAFFLGRKFVLNESVLIPRPETEELVLWMLETLSEPQLRLIDLGTGSGVIPISLKLDRPNWELTGVDLSLAALETASTNGAMHRAAVQWLAGDMLHMDLPEWDVLISNPPYIPFDEADTLAPHVVRFEPAMALFSPTNDALLFYRSLAVRARQAAPGKQLFMELNYEKALEIEGLFEGMKTEIRADLQGKARMLRVIT